MRGASVEEAALDLAIAKAETISRRHPGAYVIGADQILECDGEWLDKPTDKAAAAAHLDCLRGRRHLLVCGLAVACDGAALWRHSETASLTMRRFSQSFLESYLEETGPEILASVGAYRLENRGAQLFERIDGDYFTILGLPLLPLLSFLREHGVLRV